jgi:DNA-binding transcriptional ArsR family regulator
MQSGGSHLFCNLSGLFDVSSSKTTLVIGLNRWTWIMREMPIEFGRPSCRAIAPSVPAELAWLLNLLAQTARYAEPALAELDASLLPGVSRLRLPVRERFAQLWSDDLPGCPELMYVAHAANCVLDADPNRLFAWLERPRVERTTPYAMLTEPEADRPAIAIRLRQLRDDAKLRSDYRSVLVDVWQLAANAWQRTGRAVAIEACVAWQAKLDGGASIEELAPPRHPLTRAEQLGFDDLFTHRPEFTISPLFFCMSGGHVIDLDDYVHVAVPASDLLPLRKTRDSAFVADRLRVLAEPTRVHILIQLLSAPSGVMEIARALRMSQPTVSGHLKILRDAGLIQTRRFGKRTVMVASPKRVDRLLEDARATIARWD